MTLLQAADIAMSTGLDLTTIIVAIIGLVGGGAVLKLYEAWKEKKESDQAQADEPEKFIRDMLSDQVSELSVKMDSMQLRMEELLVSEAKTASENIALIKDNNELKIVNNSLIKKNNELLEMNRQLLTKIDELTTIK